MENKKNKILKYLGRTLPSPERYLYSKLGNELTLIGTKRCNLNCKHCYDKANLSGIQKQELTTRQIKNLIRIVKKFGVNRIRLTGGEFLIREDFLEILSNLKDFKITLCTNGAELEKFLPKIHKIKLPNLTIHISLDGLKSHNEIRRGSDYNKILNLIKKIKNYGYRVSINTVLMDKNILEIPKMYKGILGSGADFWSISFPRLVENALKKNFKLPKIGEINNSFKKLLKTHYQSDKKLQFSFSYFYKVEFENNPSAIPKINLNYHPCMPDGSGCKGLIIDSFGNIIDCLVMKPLIKDPVNIKHLLDKENLEDKEFSDYLYDSLESDFYKLKISDTHCKDCRYLNLCKGGCPANAYYLLNDIKKEDILSCKLFINFEKNILPLLNEKDKQIYGPLIRQNKSIDPLNKSIKKHEEKMKKLNFY